MRAGEYSEFDLGRHDKLFSRVSNRVSPSQPMPAASKPPSFEGALQELERIVQAMEGGAAPLDEALANYERGMKLLKYCQEALAGAEQKIRLLDNGELRRFAGTDDAAET